MQGTFVQVRLSCQKCVRFGKPLLQCAFLASKLSKQHFYLLTSCARTMFISRLTFVPVYTKNSSFRTSVTDVGTFQALTAWQCALFTSNFLRQWNEHHSFCVMTVRTCGPKLCAGWNTRTMDFWLCIIARCISRIYAFKPTLRSLLAYMPVLCTC